MSTTTRLASALPGLRPKAKRGDAHKTACKDVYEDAYKFARTHTGTLERMTVHRRMQRLGCIHGRTYGLTQGHIRRMQGHKDAYMGVHSGLKMHRREAHTKIQIRGGTYNRAQRGALTTRRKTHDYQDTHTHLFKFACRCAYKDTFKIARKDAYRNFCKDACTGACKDASNKTYKSVRKKACEDANKSTCKDAMKRAYKDSYNGCTGMHTRTLSLMHTRAHTIKLIRQRCPV